MHLALVPVIKSFLNLSTEHCSALRSLILRRVLQGVRDAAVELLHTLVAAHAEVLGGNLVFILNISLLARILCALFYFCYLVKTPC